MSVASPPPPGGPDQGNNETRDVDPGVQRVLASIRANKDFTEGQALETDHWLRARAREAFPDCFVRGDHKEVAEHLREVLGKDKIIYDLGEIYRYRASGLWAKVPHGMLQAIVSDLAGVQVLGSKHPKPFMAQLGTVRDGTKLFDLLVDSSPRNRRFESAPYGLGFENGFLTMEDGAPVLRPHHPDNLCRFSYDFAYAPHAPHPLLDRFFATTFRDQDAESQVKTPLLLQEFVGACLFGRASEYEKVLILIGGGGNGKSQFLEIARSLFPVDSLAALPPQKWGEPFSIEGLAGKLANFVDEIPEREITSQATFKAVISGQMLTAQRKYRDNLTFRPIAGHILSANNLFSTTDTSDGFFRRFLIVPFTSKPTQDEIVTDIGKKIGREEKRALVSWAVAGYARLLAQNGVFTQPPSVTRRTAAWHTEADRVRLFFCALYAEHPGADWFSIAELYKRYRQWCEASGILPVSLQNFTKGARNTRMVVDKDQQRARGFVWDLEACERIQRAMGAERVEWGQIPELPNHTYGGGFSSSAAPSFFHR